VAAGLLTRLRPVRRVRLEPPTFSADAHPTGVKNADGIAAFAVTLADAIDDALDDDLFPLVLGGDCSILLGTALALRRRGRYGLLHVDGHADFAHPDHEPAGEAASMDLALVTGRGRPLLTDIERRRPLVRDEDAVQLGFRAEADATDHHLGVPIRSTPITVRGLPEIRARGIEACLDDALAVLVSQRLAGFALHLDVDVLDDAVMPAVDYRVPDGLSPDELSLVLERALASGRCAAMQVTILNPALDPDGSIVERFARLLDQAIEQGLGARMNRCGRWS